MDATTATQALPDFLLRANGPLALGFLALGSRTYRDAACHVRDLPYGRNSDRSDYRLVLCEGWGTCSTKHALLAALAQEHGAAVELRLGVYLMDETNTPGVGGVLRSHGLDGLPEAHCYLSHRGRRIDLRGAQTGGPRRFLHEETIGPDAIGEYKLAAHRAFLRAWAEDRGQDAERLWRVREECIAALSEQEDKAP